MDAVMGRGDGVDGERGWGLGLERGKYGRNRTSWVIILSTFTIPKEEAKNFFWGGGGNN